MAEELNKIFTAIQAYDADPKSNKISLARKRENIYQVQSLVKQLEKRALIQIQGQVVTFVFTMARHGCGASMVRAMIDTIRYLYQNGGDFTKMPTEFFEPCVQIITNPKTPSQARFVAIQLSAKVFKQVWNRMGAPPAKELYEAYTSLKQKNAEKYIREAAFKGLKDIIKVNCSGFHLIQNDVLKYLIKQLKDEKEKSTQIKVQMAGCLNVFIRETMTTSNLHTSFDMLFQVCIKGFEETDAEVQYQYVKSCYSLLNMRLQESEKQGDIRTDFRTWNQRQKDNMQPQQKKKQATSLIDVPRTLSDMFAMFGAMLLRLVQSAAGQAKETNQGLTQVQINIRSAISQLLCLLVSGNVSHLEASEPEMIMNSLLLTIQNCKEEPLESQRQRLAVVWIIGHYVQCMQLEQRTQLLKHCLQCLGQKQLLLKKETLDSITSFCGKNVKVSSLVNEGQQMALLQVVNDIIFEFDQKTLHSAFQSEKEIVDAVVPYMSEQYPFQTRKCTIEVIKTLGAKSYSWIHSLISTFMSSVQLASADIMSIQQSFIYAKDPNTDTKKAEKLLDIIRTLNCHALALACLFQSVPRALQGVPVALVSSAMNVVKTLILGGQSIDIKTEEQKNQMYLSKVNPLTSQRREAGWIILQGFLYLGKDWIKSEISIILKLLKFVFRKETCMVEYDKINEPRYQEAVLREFVIKSHAVACLKTLLEEFDTLITEKPREMKQVANCVCHATTFFMDTSEKQVFEKVLSQKFGHHQVAQAKADLFACLTLLPPEQFSTKFVTLLHPVVGVIVSQDGGTNKIPTIHKELLHDEDSFIVPSFPLVAINDAKDKKKEPVQTGYKDIAIKTRAHRNLLEKRFDLFDNLTSQSQNQIELNRPLLELCKPISRLDPHFGTAKGHSIQPRQQLLCNAIRLFAHIFTSEQLNEKNKNQLLKHFTVHVQPSAPSSSDKKDKKDKDSEPSLPFYRADKIAKMIRIALTMLLVAKKTSESFADNSQPTLALGDQQHAMILAILSSIELSRNDFLVRIVAETFVYLHAEQILNNQDQTLELILSELERDSKPLAAGAKQTVTQEAARIVKLQRASAVLGIMMRNFDYDTILAPVEPRMNQIMASLIKDNDLAVRKFAFHYATVMAEQGPCNANFFEVVFQQCFHFVQTDIKPDYHAVSCLARLTNTQWLKNNPAFFQQHPRAQVVVHELIEILLLNEPKQREKEIVIQALNCLKMDILLTGRMVQSRGQQVVEMLLRMLGSIKEHHCKVKVKVVEVIAALVYKGYYAKIDAQSKQQLSCVLLDQLNQSMRENTTYTHQRASQVDIVKALTSNEDFEKLVNYSNEYNLEELNDDELLQAEPSPSHCLYQRCLKLLYLLMFKVSALIDFNQAILFTKTIMNYRHTTPLQKLERVLQDGPQAAAAAQASGGCDSYVFAYDLSDFVRCFLMETFKNYVELFCTVDTENRTDIRSQASTLISLAFATLSQDSTNLKKVGFSLIICLVDHFSQSIEKIADDDDEEDQAGVDRQKLKIKTFLSNPLLLEQYEAQIYTIIKLHLNKGGSQTVPPEIVAKNFELIQLFITTPICKDESILSKIFDMLMDGMAKSTQLLGAQMHSHEAIITETHFKKLNLLCKLAMQAHHGLDPIQQAQKSTTEKVHQRDQSLPSKFQAEDRQRLLGVVKQPGRSQALLTHLIAALNDILILSLGPKGDQKKFRFITPGCCPPSSNEAQVIRNTMNYCLEGIQIILQHEKTVQLSQEDWSIITLSLFLGLSTGIKGNNFDDASIRRYIRGKMHDLTLVKSFLELEPGAFKSTPLDLSELCNILLQLPRLGVFEINEKTLQIMQIVLGKDFHGSFNEAMKTEFLQKFISLSVGMLHQVVPEFNTQAVTQQASYGFQETKTVQSRQDIPQEVKSAQIQSSYSTLSQILKYQISQSQTATSPERLRMLKITLAQCIGRIAVNIDKLPDTEGSKKFYILQLAQIVQQQWPQQQLRDEVLLPVLVSSVYAASKRSAGDEQPFSSFSAALLHNFAQTIGQTTDGKLLLNMRAALNAVLFSDGSQSFPANLRTYLPMMQRGVPNNQLSQHLISQLFVTLHRELSRQKSDQTSEQAIQVAVNLISTFYRAPNALSPECRAGLLQPLFTLLFTVMNSTVLSPQTRNATAEHVFQVFMADQAAFKKFAETNPATGQGWLTVAEKDLVQKIVTKYQAAQATQQTAAQSSAPASQKEQPSTRQPLASATGNKIKLGFNFKKK